MCGGSGVINPQGSVLGTLLFLIKIHDLEEGIESHVKFFADPMVSADKLQQDINSISEWAHQWKMSFNPDPTKQAEEICSHKKLESIIHHFTSITLRLKG